MLNLARFSEQVVVITGASRGIGRGVALRFAAEGARVVLAANEVMVHTKGVFLCCQAAAALAGLVTFLASDDAAYITGQTINVDGGLFMS